MANRIVTATVSGENIKLSSRKAGAAGSYNAVSLAFTFDSAWDGTTKKVYFFNVFGDNPVVVTLTDNLLVDGAYIVKIPSEPLEYAGENTITAYGVELAEDGETIERIIVSATTHMTVDPSTLTTSDNAPVEPTPTQAEQLQAAIDSVTGMTVSATGLPYGSSPTATKTINVDGTINIEYGLVQGEQGIQGIQGVQGEQGIQGEQGEQGIQGLPGNVGYVYTATLPYANWLGTEAPYRQTLTISGIELTGYAYVVSAGTDYWLEYSGAQIRMAAPTTANEVTFFCTTLPTVDIGASIMKVRLDS